MPKCFIALLSDVRSTLNFKVILSPLLNLLPAVKLFSSGLSVPTSEPSCSLAHDKVVLQTIRISASLDCGAPRRRVLLKHTLNFDSRFNVKLKFILEQATKAQR
jgi:hypothetical protein